MEDSLYTVTGHWGLGAASVPPVGRKLRGRDMLFTLLRPLDIRQAQRVASRCEMSRQAAGDAIFDSTLIDVRKKSTRPMCQRFTAYGVKALKAGG